ncbi:hypothetical protein ALQ20_103083 [Pseudomonas syringae pv. atrofaciens]|nr:hypothetical protein ALQ20_103083 [Pseudomonas syringae pv. atrofaciens]
MINFESSDNQEHFIIATTAKTRSVTAHVPEQLAHFFEFRKLSQNRPHSPKVTLKAGFLHCLFRHFRKLVKQIRLTDDVQVACAIHGQAFGLGGAVLEVGEGTQQ